MRQLKRLAPRRHHQQGLTLIELMVALAISALLVVAAAPFLGDYLANSRLREAGNALYAETLFAQSEAQKRNARVRVSVAGSNIRTLDMSGGGTGELLRESNLAAPVRAAVDTAFEIGSNGRPAPAGGVAAADVAVNLVLDGLACTADRRCPGLRVDTGGAVRLCGDYLNSCP